LFGNGRSATHFSSLGLFASTIAHRRIDVGGGRRTPQTKYRFIKVPTRKKITTRFFVTIWRRQMVIFVILYDRCEVLWMIKKESMSGQW
jgi:hypothetical protein